MSGLLQKDLCLIFQRSRSLLVLAGVGIIMGFSTDGSFVIGYITMLCAILTVGTVSYDEFDNGYPFLLTLPITKKTYVIAKYIFCLLGGLAGWVIAVAIYAGCALAKGSAFGVAAWGDAAAFIPVLAVMIALVLPLQLKFGTEKSRLALAVVGGCIFALIYIGKTFLSGKLHLPAALSQISNGAAMTAFCVLGLAALAVSYGISLGIMNRKEW